MTAPVSRRLLVVLLVLGSASALSTLAADCNGNGIEDACDLSCGAPGGGCDVPGCGTAQDCDGNAVPDSCDLAANGAGCRFTSLLASNSTTSPDSTFVGPPDDLYYGLGGQQVTYRFTCGFVVDGPGPDFNVYEVDSGSAEFSLIDVLVSANGIDFASVRASIGAKVDIDGDEAHGNASFARAFDLLGSGLSVVRYIRIDGDGSGASGSSAGFDLDAIGVIHRLGLDCDADGTLDACEAPADCDGDAAPDACTLAAGIVPDCNANAVPDRCDAGSTSLDCDADHRPDECQADCNASGRPDACDIAGLSSPDCNTNGVPDECDLAPTSPYLAESQRLRPIGSGYTQTWTVRSAFPAWGPVTLSVTAASDLNAADEYVSVDLNGVPLGRVFESGGVQCGASVGTLIIDPVLFNDAVANGDAVFGFVASSAVNKQECPESWIEADLSYDASVDCDAGGGIDHCQIDAAPGLDLNDNGVLDGCEADCNGNGSPDDYDVETGLSPDCNTNGQPDECDIASGASTDCDANAVPDECQPDCNSNGVADPCDIAPGGASADCDANGIPDECDLAAAGAGCPFPVRLAQNTTTADASRLVGPPDDVFWGLGGQIVTYEWTCGRIVDGSGPDLTVYEVDGGDDEFESVSVLVSDDGVTFQDITGSMVAGVRIAGDAAHGGILFRRSYDLAYAGVRRARFVKLDGAGTGGSGSSTGFDLDAIGAIHLIDRDCNGSGGLDACEPLADCDADGLPDLCQVAAVAGADCTGNGIPDACDVAGGAADCNADGVPDTCQPDCNGNAVADACDIAGASSADCNANAPARRVRPGRHCAGRAVGAACADRQRHPAVLHADPSARRHRNRDRDGHGPRRLRRDDRIAGRLAQRYEPGPGLRHRVVVLHRDLRFRRADGIRVQRARPVRRRGLHPHRRPQRGSIRVRGFLRDDCGLVCGPARLRRRPAPRRLQPGVRHGERLQPERHPGRLRHRRRNQRGLQLRRPAGRVSALSAGEGRVRDGHLDVDDRRGGRPLRQHQRGRGRAGRAARGRGVGAARRSCSRGRDSSPV